jgi:hypothetical protein
MQDGAEIRVNERTNVRYSFVGSVLRGRLALTMLASLQAPLTRARCNRDGLSVAMRSARPSSSILILRLPAWPFGESV